MPFFQGASSFNVNGSSFNDIKGDMHQTVNNTKHIIKDSYNSSNATYNDSFNNSSQSHQYGPSPGTVCA
ncbi:hypothetical protein FA15DRAFT_587401 [Coprinopsis marcescibilis]|uniref:Uncharacterized protein n=1 Tax=Coprinopsis marcescibilis TaxID=230819 RepID=A0A5C3L320_COPMA|nr:hypothetical protein FA15DRAFT_587401 [Coprinopsis marcescibilis]